MWVDRIGNGRMIEWFSASGKKKEITGYKVNTREKLISYRIKNEEGVITNITLSVTALSIMAQLAHEILTSNDHFCPGYDFDW